MVTEPHFQLTTRDHAILQTMLERHRGPYDAFASLLERKVRESIICFSDDIPANVVTLNTRLTYLLDNIQHGPHTIVQDAVDEDSGALPLHSLSGLALLGLAEGAAFSLQTADGTPKLIQVLKIESQPEAQARAASQLAHNVVSFRPRRAAPLFPPVGIDPDDDPGPGAA